MSTSQETRRTPGPARTLTRGQIVDAGLVLMRSGGLSAVTLRGVARVLGVNPMTLYTYVQDKDALLAAMFDALLSDLTVPGVGDPRSVSDQLVAFFTDARRTLREHTDLYRLVRPRADAPLVHFDQSERLTELFLAVGIPPERVLTTWKTVMQLTVGSALFASGTQGRSLDDTIATEQLTESEAELFPNLAIVLRQPETPDPEDVFTDAVRALLRAARERRRVR